MPTYRFFLTRTYIAVQWYDVEAPTAGKARAQALKTVRRLRRNPRAEATDNGWLDDSEGEVRGMIVDYPGYPHDRRLMEKVAKGVYAPKDG